MTPMEKNLLQTIDHSFDIISVCYLSSGSSCCGPVAAILTKLGGNMTSLAEELDRIGKITKNFSIEFYLTTSYLNKLSEWTVVSNYPQELSNCQSNSIETPATNTSTPSSDTTEVVIEINKSNSAAFSKDV